MAYAVPIDRICDSPECEKRATYEVRNSRNAVVQRCCWRHAERLVRELSAGEAQRWIRASKEQA